MTCLRKHFTSREYRIGALALLALALWYPNSTIPIVGLVALHICTFGMGVHSFGKEYA